MFWLGTMPNFGDDELMLLCVANQDHPHMDLDARRLSPHKQVRHIIVSHLATPIRDVRRETGDPVQVVERPGLGFEQCSDIPVRMRALRVIPQLRLIIQDETAGGGRRADGVHADLHDLLDVRDGGANPCVEPRVPP